MLVQECSGFEGVATVLHTDFVPVAKIPDSDAAELARRYVESVLKADEGREGITYLINARNVAIVTPKMSAYEGEILRRTDARTLDEGARSGPSGRRRGRPSGRGHRQPSLGVYRTGPYSEATRSSSNTSGWRSASSRSRRAISEGCLAPRSQARTVETLAPSKFTNTVWDKPSRSRTR